jgi:hypothetical protein
MPLSTLVNIYTPLSISAPPSSGQLILSFSCLQRNGSIVEPLPIWPSVLSYSTATLPSLSLFSFLMIGNYTLSVSLSGSDASKYVVTFPEGDLFQVTEASIAPKLPFATSATFTSDGLAVIVKFDSPTDQAALVNQFRCSLLFSFMSASDATCQWVSPMSLQMTLGGKYRMRVGSNITLLGGTLRAECFLTRSQCLSWSTVPSLPSLCGSGLSVCGRCSEGKMDL